MNSINYFLNLRYVINSSDRTTWDFKGEYGGNTNMLGLIVVSVVMGLAVAVLGDEALPVLQFVTSFTAVMMKITSWIIFLAPVGVMFLVAGAVMDMKDPAETFSRLGVFFATVLTGLAIHGGITLPLIYCK